MPLQILVLVTLFALPIAPTIWALNDIPRRRFGDRRRKLKWFVLVATIPFFAALYYGFFIRRHTVPCEANLIETDQDHTEVN
jgi:hypothetical protein